MISFSAIWSIVPEIKPASESLMKIRLSYFIILFKHHRDKEKSIQLNPTIDQMSDQHISNSMFDVGRSMFDVHLFVPATKLVY